MLDEQKPTLIADISIRLGRTLAIIKPDAIDRSDEIEEIIQQHGFTILQVAQAIADNYLITKERPLLPTLFVLT